QIAKELLRIGSQLVQGCIAPAPISEKPEDKDGFIQILRLLTDTSSVDFLHYKHSTLRRRIDRRMVLRRAQNLADYLHLLRSDRAEMQALYEEVLIPVTGFFRDPETFDALKTVIFPRLLENRPLDAPVRIWVPGCSTGEEAYSLAISLLE